MLRSVLSLDHILAMSADDAAALWLVRQDSHEDPRDDDLFQQWLEADAANGVAWARACSLWEGLAEVGEVDTQALREEALVERPYRARWRLAVAASVALVAVAGGALVLSGRTASLSGAGETVTVATRAKPRPEMFATAIGARRTVTLSDGSVVTLNTDTAIAVAYTPTERRIELLRGQALFVDTHDAHRPFLVVNGGRSVTAIGTQFEVRVLNEAMRVVLIEGRVRVRARFAGQPRTVDLTAGQQLEANQSKFEMSSADLAGATEWQRGLVTFHNTSLADAAVEFNRYATSKRLLIRDPRVAAIRVSGAFHTDDIGRFARTSAQIYPVRVVENGSTVEIVSNGASRR